MLAQTYAPSPETCHFLDLRYAAAANVCWMGWVTFTAVSQWPMCYRFVYAGGCSNRAVDW